MGAVMLIPALYDYLDFHENYNAFLDASLISLGLSGLLYFSNKDIVKFETLTIREAFFLTATSWCLVSVIGAMPFVFSDLQISLTDAIFESVSGITTTGSTVLFDLDHKSRGILLWRSILQWLGGIGIVAFAIVLLPFLRVGGMQLFHAESSDRSDKLFPKAKDIVFSIVFIYIFLTLLCMVAYFELGMGAFEAINHAFTTISTGGFSTHDVSFGFYDQTSLRLVATLFMLLGSLPFILYVRLIARNDTALFKDQQVLTFLMIIFTAVCLLSFNHVVVNEESFWGTIVTILFHVVSVVTTTGYALGDYSVWGTFAIGLFFFLTYLGGCTGSTAGGAKTVRLIVAFEVLKYQIKKLIYPNSAVTMRYQNKELDYEIIQSTMFFGGIYVLTNVVLILILTFMGLDFMTAFSGAATAVANVGPGLGDVIGPADNFSGLPDAAKLVLAAGMLLGRLEIITILILFTPFFWSE